MSDTGNDTSYVRYGKRYVICQIGEAIRHMSDTGNDTSYVIPVTIRRIANVNNNDVCASSSY